MEKAPTASSQTGRPRRRPRHRAQSAPSIARPFLADQERIAADNAKAVAETERKAREEEARRVEAVRLQAARVEAARVEAACVQAARVEAARVEATRVEATRVEAQRVEAVRLAAAQQAEADRLQAAAQAAQEQQQAPTSAYYANCDAVRAAGAAPIFADSLATVPAWTGTATARAAALTRGRGVWLPRPEGVRGGS